jgi:dynein heavy chain, axonemal
VRQQAEAKACQDKLSLAERLTTGLASENSRWAKEVESLRMQEVRWGEGVTLRPMCHPPLQGMLGLSRLLSTSRTLVIHALFPSREQITLIGDVLLAAAFVSYAGAFSAEYRERLWKDIWKVR